MSEQKRRTQAIKHLLLNGHHLYVAIEPAQLDLLFTQNSTYTIWTIEEETTTINKIVGVLVLQNPPTQPTAPAYLAALALQKGRSPLSDLSLLIRHSTDNLYTDDTDRPTQLVVMGAHKWMIQPLLHAGFEIVDRIQVFSVDAKRLGRTVQQNGTRIPRVPIEIRDYRPTDMPAMLNVDAQVFDVLWQTRADEFAQLSQTHRIRVARLLPSTGIDVGVDRCKVADKSRNIPKDLSNNQEELIIGYAAITDPFLNDGSTTPDYAIFTRLAVAPTMQGKDIGYALFYDCLQWATTHKIATVFLNTSINNQSALSLYKKFGFQYTGVTQPVMMMTT
ncbi:MAG: GNAT family N-acetyltransferase [Chloroflexota bacterium]